MNSHQDLKILLCITKNLEVATVGPEAIQDYLMALVHADKWSLRREWNSGPQAHEAHMLATKLIGD